MSSSTLPSAQEIALEEHKSRIIRVEPWIAAHLSDVWQGMKKVLKEEVIAVGKQEHDRSGQSKPASSRSH